MSDIREFEEGVRRGEAQAVLLGMTAVAKTDYWPSDEILDACRKLALNVLPRERQFEEWSRLLVEGVRISRGLGFLRTVGWVGNYPELSKLIGCKQDPEWHPEGDVWNHTLCCLDAYAAARPENPVPEEELIVGFAVLCHDFGKPACTSFDPRRGRIRSLGHDEAGVEPTLAFLRRLTDDPRILESVPPLVRLHMRPFAMWKDDATDSAIRRLAASAGSVERLLRVSAADDAGRPPFPSEPEPLEWLARRWQAICAEDAKPKPIVMGRHLLAEGLKPGPGFKRLLDACYEAQLRGEFSDLPSGLAFARSVNRQKA